MNVCVEVQEYSWRECKNIRKGELEVKLQTKIILKSYKGSNKSLVYSTRVILIKKSDMRHAIGNAPSWTTSRAYPHYWLYTYLEYPHYLNIKWVTREPGQYKHIIRNYIISICT